MCLSVPKDLANHLTDIVHLYSVASHKSWEMFIAILGESTTHHPPKRNRQIRFTNFR